MKTGRDFQTSDTAPEGLAFGAAALLMVVFLRFVVCAGVSLPPVGGVCAKMAETNGFALSLRTSSRAFANEPLADDCPEVLKMHLAVNTQSINRAAQVSSHDRERMKLSVVGTTDDTIVFPRNFHIRDSAQ